MITDIASLRTGVQLAPYTTYGIGGPADYFITATNAQELAAAVRGAVSDGIPYFILGLGANILMGDGGFRGLVILNRAEDVTVDGATLTAESGVTMERLVSITAAHGLSGLEHFAGIPSTVGGALWQNLHFLSPDRQRTIFISEVVSSVRILTSNGEEREVGPDYFKFGYDQSVLREDPSLTALVATFLLQSEDAAVLRERIRANLSWRSERHPDITEYPSCGSVFKQIKGAGAGRLIESVGLKGHRIGGAQISEKHANFIVNRGGATAADVNALIALAQETVYSVLGHRLETEIHRVGER